MGPIVPDKCIQFRDPRLNSSGEIQPKAVGCGIFFRFSNVDNCRAELTGDVISGKALEYLGLDVLAKLGDSRLNNGRIIRLFARP